MPLDSDLSTLRAFLADFEQYLKSDVIFWTVGSDMPALTLGGLLFVRRALTAQRAAISPQQSIEFDRLDLEAETLFSRWPVNIEKKALREISSRLNVWASAIEEAADHPHLFADNYSHAINTRVYIGLLLPLVSRVPEADRYRNRLSMLDTRLRATIAASGFILDAALALSFPPGEFWFLYGKPKKV